MAFFDNHFIFESANSKFRRAAAISTLFLALAGCQSGFLEKNDEWAAHGFMGPTTIGESELIGVYTDRGDCERAAKAWTERQVVGNPVSAACYPVDKH